MLGHRMTTRRVPEMTTVLQGAATAIHRAGEWRVGAQHGWRDPARATVESMLLPGLGTIRNGELWKGIGILAGFLVSIPLMVVLLGMITLPAFWVAGIVDAYEGARRRNVAFWHSR